jgi:hypothetical protein
MPPKIKRPTIFEMVDILYEYHHNITISLYPKGTGIMIDRTINKVACLASIEHCERQLNNIKENKRKNEFSPLRFSDELCYWITVKEIIKNKLI